MSAPPQERPTAPADAAPTSAGAQVGRSAPRSDAPEKIGGSARFTGDLSVPGMVHGRVLRSPVAHAKIRSIDASAAERMPGVVAVLTAADLADLDQHFGHLVKDRPVVATGRVRFVGEPVAAVAAETEQQAEEALLLIDVEYEDLPVAADVDDALAPDSVRLHEEPSRPGPFYGYGELPDLDGNVCYTYRDQRGDADAIFEQADVVVEGEYRFPAVYQYAMEPHTVIAQYTAEEITLWSSCQHPFLVRYEIASLFGLAPAQVRIIVPYLGGGFGSKSYTKMEPITAALARKAGRPVRIANRVDEAMATTRRHAMRCWMRTAAAADGTVLARQARIALDTGAYADNGPTVALIAGMAAPGPYRWQAVDVEASCVYTNRSPAGSYRGFGAAHMTWIGESQIDELAGRLGVDRLDIRLHNLLERGELVRPGLNPLDADLRGDLKEAAAALEWDIQAPSWEGKGISVGVSPGGASPASNALVRLDTTGDIAVIVGTTEIGQGARTVLAQIAAEVLGMRAEDVTVHGTDTRFTPFDRSTGASRSTTLAGLAVERGARDLLRQLVESAGAAAGVPPDEVVCADGETIAGDQRLTYSEIVRRRTGTAGGEMTGTGTVGPEGALATMPAFWEICVAGAHVAVDPETGAVRVRHAVTVADVGKAINPQLVERQDEGCTMQAIGNTLFEEMAYASDGTPLNDTLLDYKVPTFADVPDRSTCVIIENGDGPGPFGAKGCGEGVFGGLPAAIVNALGDAGVRVRRLPATPERVWSWLQDADGVTA